MNKEVLIVSQEFPPGPGGIGSHAYSMAKSFHEKGIDVTVVASMDYVTPQQVEVFDNKQPFKVVRFDRNTIFHFIKRFATVWKNMKQNVIYSGRFPLWVGLFFSIFKPRVNSIAVLHGSEVRPSSKMYILLTHLSIWAIKNIVAVSAFTKDLIPRWTIRNKKVEVIPNGINPQMFKIPEAKQHLKGYPAILTVGNVTPRKGQHRIIKVLPAVLKKYPDAHYHIVGLPTYKDEFLKLAEEKGVAQAVTFHGKAEKFEDLFDFYYSADVFAILSENQPDGDCEGFGIVVLEAGIFGLPTIGATGNGIADAVKPGHNGMLVDGDNPQEFCEALTTILENKEEFSQNANTWALNHDWNNIINDFIQILK
ncbi:MAG: glycosyltransferase family 4 protein [Bacteroidaceae bacterium]|nr:glycosyltransferase family 4 protein [Bacteroidaceae bacterium]